MLTAITRKVSSALANCELSFIERKPIDMEKARAQHHAYEELLSKLGASVISLPEESELPDSMFVEDPAVVLDEVAVICPLGTESRRKEAVTIAAALEKFRKLAYVKLPGTLEGGDVLRVGRKVFVGFTARSNPEGIRQFSVILEHLGYDVTAVRVTGCLHLKSAVTYLGRNTLLANRAWFDWKRMEGFEWVDRRTQRSACRECLGDWRFRDFPGVVPEDPGDHRRPRVSTYCPWISASYRRRSPG